VFSLILILIFNFLVRFFFLIFFSYFPQSFFRFIALHLTYMAIPTIFGVPITLMEPLPLDLLITACAATVTGFTVQAYGVGMFYLISFPFECVLSPMCH